MKKRVLATLQFEHRVMGQKMESTVESLIEVIQSSFSALATVDPETALFVLTELNKHTEPMTALVKERADDQKEYVDLLTSKLPDSLELEDDAQEDEQDEEEE